MPGVGKKTAARLLVELKSRLDLPDIDASPPVAPATVADQLRPPADVREALAGLGYGARRGPAR